jgi:hypothetical protein
MREVLVGVPYRRTGDPENQTLISDSQWSSLLSFSVSGGERTVVSWAKSFPVRNGVSLSCHPWDGAL